MDIKKRTLVTPMQTHDNDRLRNMVRICGVCQVTLGPQNTGPLKWLQPDCNDCTKKQLLEERQALFTGK